MSRRVGIKTKKKTGTDDGSSVPMMEPCAAFSDEGFQAHGCDIQGDKQPVETPAGKNARTAASSPHYSPTQTCAFISSQVWKGS